MKIAIQKSLQKIADPKKGKEISSYMKNVLPFRGLQQPQIHSVFQEFRSQIAALPDNEKFELADELMKQEFGEDKKVGLMIAEKISFDLQRVKLTEKWFIDGHIKEWATADTYCGRVLKNFLKDKENAKLMMDWAKHDNLWMRRSSCVGFVTLARKKDVCDLKLLYDICQENIPHQERFNQLGTGWLLREMSIIDLKGVITFIEQNIHNFTSEGLRYAYEKMKISDQNYLKDLLKQQKSQPQQEEFKVVKQSKKRKL